MAGDEGMRAARFEQVGRPLELREVPVPRPGPGEVLVRVAATGLCGSDVHIAVEGVTPTALPITLGHEIAGTVAKVGEGVAGWAPGARVCVFPVLSDGTCRTCLQGRSEICLDRRIVGIHIDGGLAEYVVVPAVTLAAVPDAIPLEQAAICTDAVVTPFHALADVARLAPGESVAVLGVGGLGLHAVQVARLVGASPVVAVDTRPAQLERALRAGADVAVDATRESVVDAVLAATGGNGIDVAAEFVGAQVTIAQAVEALCVGGRAVVAGLGADPITVLPPTSFVRRQLQLLGSYGGTRTTLRRVLDLVGTGRLDLGGSITHRFALDDADEALRTLHLRSGDPQRVVVLQG
ncbi:2-desacetyl-2-hydroxyethyl bacteriochlorophyllide A dehydrogenase [Geodermatophilus tzadiensis]|uniref:2-desacetyl-2-hydroxyethyl bacteriochlorophyllide A dehydrogenase n=1 Tax=Geodermatophilus tzadiensis TaxID=1137988 RepID=A0A2T0TWR3_9ACTN|nr:zinc-binding dehydrogenase [Geodermatophilus tzadiensis]PRY50142.1 2-desacetyl-2-hydroxyethyl bacteriochlorophyllide A dehydrogenase [Geodermatophilus tzadiensis]